MRRKRPFVMPSTAIGRLLACSHGRITAASQMLRLTSQTTDLQLLYSNKSNGGVNQTRALSGKPDQARAVLPQSSSL